MVKNTYREDVDTLSLVDKFRLTQGGKNKKIIESLILDLKLNKKNFYEGRIRYLENLDLKSPKLKQTLRSESELIDRQIQKLKFLFVSDLTR